MSDLSSIRSPGLHGLIRREFHQLKPQENVVILVAGHSFARCADPDKHEGRYRTRCENRVEFLSKTYSNAQFLFVLFDVARGTIETNSNGERKAGGNALLWKLAPAKFLPVSNPPSCRDHKGGRFDAYSRNPKRAHMMLSITNVYNHVAWYGKNKPGVVVELSFFSHASRLGPILVNSYERRDAIVEENGRTIIELQPKGQQFVTTHPNKKTINFDALVNDRDPQDKDGRHRKDFLRKQRSKYVLRYPTNMMDKDLAAFQKAFDKENGMIWIWGCDADKACYYLWDRLRKLPNYGALFLSGYQNLSPKQRVRRVKVTFSRTNKFHQKIVKALSGKDAALFPKGAFSFRPSVREIRRFYLGALYDTYMFQAADAVSIRTFGAAPGTWSGFGKNGLMEVKRNPPGGDKHKELIEFYTRFLNVREAPLDLGYITFPP